MKSDLRFCKKGDQIFACRENQADEPVSFVWVRPQSGWGKEISVLGEKEELVLLENLEGLDAESRALVETSLARHYFIPVINKILKAESTFGTRYIQVETDSGYREFALKNPYVNIRPLGLDGLLIQDVIGNLFRIDSLSLLDIASREKLEGIT